MFTVLAVLMLLFIALEIRLQPAGLIARSRLGALSLPADILAT